MTQSTQRLYWNQVRDFSSGEWGVIRRHAERLVADATAKGQGIVADLRMPGQISLNGAAMTRGERFLLTRQTGVAEWSCETHGHPYARLAANLLSFAAKVAPDALGWTRDYSPLESYRRNRRMALYDAYELFHKSPAAPIEETAREYAHALGCDTGTVTLPAVKEARARIVDARYAPYLFENGPIPMKVSQIYTGDDGTTGPGSAPDETVLVGSPEQAQAALLAHHDRHVSEVEDATLEVDSIGELHDPASGEVLARVTGGGIEVVHHEFLVAQRDRVNHEQPIGRQAVQNGAADEPECVAYAQERLLDDPTQDFNSLVFHTGSALNANRVVARRGVEAAYRGSVDHSSILREIRDARANLSASEDGVRRMGDRTAPFPPGEMELEYHFGTLLGRAMGEWQTALLSAERALTNDKDFFWLAGVADALQRDPNVIPEKEYTCIMYRQEQNRRSHAYQIVGECARWKEAVLEFTAVLVDLEEQHNFEGTTFGQLDSYLRGNGRESRWPTESLPIVVSRMAERSQIIRQFKIGSERDGARDYLNMLELAADLGLESPDEIHESSEFKAMNLLVRGSERTVADMLADLHDEMTGAETLSLATSKELSLENLPMFQTETPPVDQTQKGSPRRTGSRL